MYKSFAKRLERDINKVVESRLRHYESVSQAKLARDQHIQARNIEVNVVSHKKQRYAVWFGGSLLADTVCERTVGEVSFDLHDLLKLFVCPLLQAEFHTYCHTKAQYEEHGPSIARFNKVFASIM